MPAPTPPHAHTGVSHRPRSAGLRTCSAIVLGTACMMHASSASADVSSWLSAGGGYGLKRNENTGSYADAASASFTLGVGSDPTKSFVVGGVLRSTTYFSLGTDLGLSARFATGGFARGQWGLAFDAGPMWRSFGRGEYGRWPISAMAIGGAPWGLQLAVGGELFRIAGDDAQARGIVALLEIDLLRLTVMRQGATDRFWENPSPAGGRSPSARSRPLAGLLW
ncbi:MAG: hypothetical protein KF850_38265 [Labilithrix sp.]|nr:hypothetical protein [Labilithrix sp.]